MPPGYAPLPASPNAPSPDGGAARHPAVRPSDAHPARSVALDRGNSPVDNGGHSSDSSADGSTHSVGVTDSLSLVHKPVRFGKLDRRRIVSRFSYVVCAATLLSFLLLDQFLVSGPSSLLWPPNPRSKQIGPLPTPATVAALAPGDQFRFLSLNAFIRPLLVGADWKDERVDRLTDVLARYAITCTQEIFWTSGSRKRRLLRSLRLEKNVPYAVTAPLPGLWGLLRWPPKIIDGGLTITSKYRIVDYDFHMYKHSVLHSIDCIVAKGVLYALVEIPLAAVPGAAKSDQRPATYAHVFTTHMQASNGLEDGPFRATRAAQLNEFAAFIRKKAAGSPFANHFIVLAGDFNVDGRAGRENPASSQAYDDMMKTLRGPAPFRDVIYDAYNSSHPVTSAGGLDGTTQKNERLDYILLHAPDGLPLRLSSVETPRVNEFLVAEETPRPPYRTLSDHYGVQAAFARRSRR